MRTFLAPCAGLALLASSPALADSIYDPDNPQAYHDQSIAECEALATRHGTVSGSVLEPATAMGFMQIRVWVTSGGQGQTYLCMMDEDGAGIGPLQAG